MSGLVKHWTTKALPELGVSVEAVERARENGELVPILLDGDLYWREDEVIEWRDWDACGRVPDIAPFLRASLVEAIEPEPDPRLRTNIYFIQEGDDGAIKIGRSKNVRGRLALLQTSNPRRLRLLGSFAGVLTDEKKLHDWFASSRLIGEWSDPTAELLDHIAEVCE